MIYDAHNYFSIFKHNSSNIRVVRTLSHIFPSTQEQPNLSNIIFNLWIYPSRFLAVSWWRHQMETFSALLPICAGNSPVPDEFPAQRPVNNGKAGDLKRHRAHCDVIVMMLWYLPLWWTARPFIGYACINPPGKPLSRRISSGLSYYPLYIIRAAHVAMEIRFLIVGDETRKIHFTIHVPEDLIPQVGEHSTDTVKSLRKMTMAINNIMLHDGHTEIMDSNSLKIYKKINIQIT